MRPQSETQPVVYETSLAEKIATLRSQTGNLLSLTGKTGESVTFVVGDEGEVIMRFPYTSSEDPVAYFKERAPLLSANTKFGDWVKGESLAVIFRSQESDKVARDAARITDATYGEGFFENL